MATRAYQGGASASPATAFHAEALERAPRIMRDWQDRKGQGEELLDEPGCDVGCAPCYRECAVRRIIADWWERKASAALAATGQALTHGGVIYAHTSGEA